METGGDVEVETDHSNQPNSTQVVDVDVQPMEMNNDSEQHEIKMGSNEFSFDKRIDRI